MQTNPAGWPQAAGNVSVPVQALDGRITLQDASSAEQVQAGWDSLLERPVTVTFAGGSDPWEQEWLLVEARLQARVDHPNVVKIHAVGTLAERPCIVSQVIGGRTLGEVAPELQLPAVVDMVRQAALGVHAAHRHGLVHRGLSPARVFVEQGEGGGLTALVGDLGLPRVPTGDGGQDAAGVDLEFTSPERILDRSPAEPRSDVYALGATLFVAIAGRPPFGLADQPPPGDEAAGAGALRRILDRGPPSLLRLAPATPPALARVVSRAMAREPAARYPSAEALARDLARFLRGEAVEARPIRRGGRSSGWVTGPRIAAAALAVALAATAVGAARMVSAARRHGLAALEAARADKGAASLEAAFRAELTGPPHDLGPALARLRSQVDALRPAAARADGGPASYTVARGLELLGDLDGARAAYRRAWDMGYRAPEVGAGLGIVLARLYQREAQRADETLDAAARDDRVRALRAELLEPAKGYLKGVDAADARGGQLRGLVALAQGEYQAARAAGAAMVAADRGRYEGHALRAEAWLGQARQKLDEQQPEEAEEALAEGRAAVVEALQWGRSDPRLLDLGAEIRLVRARMQARRGQDPAADVGAGLALLEKAEALDPADGSVLVHRALALLEKAKLAANAGRGDALPLMDQAVGILRRAAAAGPGEPRTLVRLALAIQSRAFYLRETGSPSLLAARDGLAVVADARARAPADPELAWVSMLLRLEEASALSRDSRDASDALRQAVADGEEALRLRASNPGKVRLLMGDAQVQLGREAWLAGRDPRPDLAKGIDLSERGRLDTPKGPVGSTYLASALVASAQVLLDMGETAQQPIARALAVVNEALRAKPAPASLQGLKGEMALLEARRRALTGGNELAALAEARRLLTAGAEAADARGSFQGSLAAVPLLEARWRSAAGKDPAPQLAEAEDRFREMLRRRRTAAAGYQGLAACALERGLWLRHLERPAADEAARGLGRVDQALELDARDPLLWILKARLHVLAADKDGARAALARAYGANPLARGSDQARKAESELGG